MVSSFHGLELGKRGLFAGQTGISTAGNNIANANTRGYSRQQVNLTTSPSVDVWSTGQWGYSQLGTGVSLESISRIRDRFLDEQFREQSGTLGEWSVRQDTLSNLETIMNEPSENGLGAVMDQFWNAWQDLALDPDSLPARSVIRERAQAFVDTAQAIDHSMTQLKQDLQNQVTAKVDEANRYLKQIAELNNSIRHLGSQSNDLLDQRDLLVEELSKIVSIDVKEQPNGMYAISLQSDGTSLVNGNTFENSITADSASVSGELKGLTQSIESVDNYQKKLTEMVKGFVYGEMTVTVPAGSELPDGTIATGEQQVTVNGINGLLQMGYSISKEAGGNAQHGVALFVGDEDDFTIASLEVNPEVKNDIRKIAASLRPDAVSGNGDLATIISNLRDTAITIDGKSQKIDSFYQSIVSGLGAESQNASRYVQNFDSTLQAVENRRQSVMGVSLDEEMTNLIKFQHAYNAAARIVSTTDEMLDTIINKM